jgi:hypothetical protein
MTLRVLVVIALRFYAIYFAVTFVAIMPTLLLLGDAAPQYRSTEIIVLVGDLLMAPLLWFTAHWLAKSIVREFDSTVQFQMTFENAVAFAFVFLGLYFFLTSIGGAVAQFGGLVSEAHQYPGVPRDTLEQRAIILFCRPAITCIFGLASLLGSRAWSRKIANLGSKA